MGWYAFHGASSYTANVPTLADARSEARDTQTTETGPYPTQAAAQAALGSSKAPAPPAPPPGPAQKWWVTITGNTRGGVYATVQASARPAGTAAGPFGSQGAAQAWITSQSAVHLPNPASGLTAIGNFFSLLSTPAFWVRAAEIIIGGVLLIIGLGEMTGLGHTVIQIAKNAPKVIPV